MSIVLPETSNDLVGCQSTVFTSQPWPAWVQTTYRMTLRLSYADFQHYNTTHFLIWFITQHMHKWNPTHPLIPDITARSYQIWDFTVLYTSSLMTKKKYSGSYAQGLALQASNWRIGLKEPFFWVTCLKRVETSSLHKYLTLTKQDSMVEEFGTMTKNVITVCQA